MYIEHDPRGSIVHIRKPGGECVGCIESGVYGLIYEILRQEFMEAAAKVALGGKDAGAQTDGT